MTKEQLAAHLLNAYLVGFGDGGIGDPIGMKMLEIASNQSKDGWRDIQEDPSHALENNGEGMEIVSQGKQVTQRQFFLDLAENILSV